MKRLVLAAPAGPDKSLGNVVNPLASQVFGHAVRLFFRHTLTYLDAES